jgi:hypothetical protein
VARLSAHDVLYLAPNFLPVVAERFRPETYREQLRRLMLLIASHLGQSRV